MVKPNSNLSCKLNIFISLMFLNIARAGRKTRSCLELISNLAQEDFVGWGRGTWPRIILMIVFVVYSERRRQLCKIIDGPRGVVPPLSMVTLWRQEASVTTSSSHNDMRRHMDIHHPPDTSQLGGDNWITRSHRCHNLKVKWVWLRHVVNSFYQHVCLLFWFLPLLLGAPPFSVETKGPLVSVRW